MRKVAVLPVEMDTIQKTVKLALKSLQFHHVKSTATNPKVAHAMNAFLQKFW
jgi:hypothetical protein